MDRGSDETVSPPISAEEVGKPVAHDQAPDLVVGSRSPATRRRRRVDIDLSRLDPSATGTLEWRAILRKRLLKTARGAVDPQARPGRQGVLNQPALKPPPDRRQGLGCDAVVARRRQSLYRLHRTFYVLGARGRCDQDRSLRGDDDDVAHPDDADCRIL